MQSHTIRTTLALAFLLPARMEVQTETRATSVGAQPTPQATVSARDELIARAKSLELKTPYVPPPGDPLDHHTAGFAKIMCSAVFITGLDPNFAAENVGYFTSPYAERAKVARPVIDRERKEVHITEPSGVVRTAKYLGDQGCVTFPNGKTAVSFTPIKVKRQPPDASTQAWPMGDALSKDLLPAELDLVKVKRAVDAAFQSPHGMTAAFVVTWRGRLIGERYGENITMHAPLESWSMGKSVTAALMGILIRKGVYDLWQPAPIPEWQGPGDPRAKIRIADLLHMSAGCASKRRRTPTTTRRGRILTTYISTRAASTLFSMPPRARWNGRPIPWAAITTPIRC